MFRSLNKHTKQIFFKWIKDLVVVRFVNDIIAPVILAFVVPLV